MYDALVERNTGALAALREHISFSDRVRAQVGKEEVKAIVGAHADLTAWRVIDHCSAITRTYALFEGFVMQLLKEYLAYVSTSRKFADLGGDFKIRYTRGIGQILVDQNKIRYKNFDIDLLISDLTKAIAGENVYTIHSAALLRTESNLRMAELDRIFAHCGLDGIKSWIDRHPSVIDFFQSEQRLSQTAESELQQIVEYRNEAAHGEVDQVLGAEVLVEFTTFFETLAVGIAGFVRMMIVKQNRAFGKLRVLGKITEKYHDDIIVAKITNASLAIGQEIYILGKEKILIGKIGSIQINDVNHQEFTVLDETEVGLTIGVNAKAGYELATDLPIQLPPPGAPAEL